jgi:fluoride exporter
MMAGRDGVLWTGLVAVGMGGVVGRVAAMGIVLLAQPACPADPLGTLAANVMGGYFVGIAVALFAAHPALSPFWRLLIVTGFLGGLTTFSTFSAENVLLLGTGDWGAALLHAGLHLAGSLVATAAGIATYRALA